MKRAAKQTMMKAIVIMITWIDRGYDSWSSVSCSS